MRLLVRATILLPLLGGGSALAGSGDPDRMRTESLVAAYERSDGWPVKALALLSLGERWHPQGARIVTDALRSGDPRLQAYAIEALRATSPAHLRCVLVPELLEALIRMQLREKNARVRMHLLLLLARGFPRAGAVSPEDWRRWWKTRRATWTPRPWNERAPPNASDETKTVPAPSALDRAFDLEQGGIQLVLVVDSTGSMQAMIDAVRTGLRDVFAVLSGIATDLELGLVHYRDHADFPRAQAEGAGADVLCRLTSNVAEVRKRLDGIVAGGGGDMPERVASGLWLALQRQLGWKAQANKMVIVLGDAPPHDLDRAAQLAGDARRDPGAFLKPRRGIATGRPESRRGPRPFVTSTVAVGRMGPAPVTTRAFRRISEQGGGAHVAFATHGDAREVTTEIVKRLIELSFGKRYVHEARRLVEIYFTYRDAGFIRE